MEENRERLTWEQLKELLFKYCDKNACAPSNVTIYEHQMIGRWLRHQRTKINNANDELYQRLSVNRYVKEYLDKYVQ